MTKGRPKMYCLEFAAGSTEAAIASAVAAYDAVRQESKGCPEMSADQRGSRWEIDAARRLLVFWSSTALAQSAESVEAAVVPHLSKFCAPVAHADGACVRALKFPSSYGDVPLRKHFAKWFAVAAAAADRGWAAAGSPAAAAAGSPAAAAPPAAAAAAAAPPAAPECVRLTPAVHDGGPPGACLRLTVRARRKRSASEAAATDAGAGADADALYSADQLLALVVAEVAQANRAAAVGSSKVRCYVEAAAAAAAGGFLASRDVCDVAVAPRDSAAAVRIRRLLRVLRLHAGPCDERAGGAPLSRAGAVQLFLLLKASSAGLDALDWGGMLRKDRTNRLYQKKTELFVGVKRALASGSACRECLAVLGGAGLRAYEAYRAWHDNGSVGPPTPWAEVPSVVVCDAWVHHAGGRTREVLSRYQVAVRETWPEVSHEGLCVLVSSDFLFQKGLKYLQVVRDVFVGVANAGGAAGKRVFTVPEVLLGAGGGGRAAVAAWSARSWVVLTEGVPTWQLARLLDALRGRAAAAPGRVVMTHCHETGPFAIADGGWDLFAELRGAGGGRYRFSRSRLSEDDAARLRASPDPAAAECDVAWSVGLRAPQPPALAVGAFVLASGASQQTNRASKEQRLPCRVTQVVGAASASGAQVLRLGSRVPSSRRLPASGERPLDNNARGRVSDRFYYTPRSGCGAAAAVIPADGQPPSRSDGLGLAAAYRTASLSAGAVGYRTLFNEVAAALRQTAGEVHVAEETRAFVLQQVAKREGPARGGLPQHAAALP